VPASVPAAHRRAVDRLTAPRPSHYPDAIDAAADAELVVAAQRGDEAALDALLRSHYDRIYVLCRRITGNDADAADAAQDALIAIVRGLPRFDGRSSFATWVYRVTSNACLDELRRRRRRAWPGLPDHDGGEPADSTVALDTTVADRLTLDEALARLPEDYRLAVVLRDVADLDYAEIATVLAIPPGTVRSRIARGRAALAASLGGNRAGPPRRPTPQS
jgi:RNA polymerase sigma-70 factor (ECF subfamily)